MRRVTRKCKICGKEVVIKGRNRLGKNRVTCSHECSIRLADKIRNKCHKLRTNTDKYREYHKEYSRRYRRRNKLELTAKEFIKLRKGVEYE